MESFLKACISNSDSKLNQNFEKKIGKQWLCNLRKNTSFFNHKKINPKMKNGFKNLK